MFKCVDVGSWDFGTKTAEIIPLSSSGLTASDSNSFFIKRAGEHKFKEILDRMKLAKGEVPIHLIAMGATEAAGPNRNMDGFKRAMLKRDHPTFVTNAHVYRHHDNKDPKKSYGKVAASLYNDDMDRVELLVTLNGSKEAAEKNAGLVAPDEDLKILAEGKDLPWSMGIKVGVDVCSNCQHESKTPSEYCEEHECINKNGVQRFGCKEGLGKTAEDGFVQYVDNPSGTFIDISRVGTPADRTAYGAIAKYASYTLGGANLAILRGFIETPEEKIIKQASIQIYSDALIKLAQLESTLTKDVILAQASFDDFDDLDQRIIKHAKYLHNEDKYQELMHLADFNIILGPKQFAKFAGLKVTDGYKAAVNGLFNQLDQAIDNRAVILNECCKYGGVKKQSLPPFFNLYKQAQHYTAKGLRERLIDTSLNPRVKVAAKVAPKTDDYKAAIEYAIYKIAALVRLNSDENYITAVIQNNV